MEVVLGHWDAWDDGAVLVDKKTGRYADPSKVKRLEHEGTFFKSRGPFTVPRSAQGHPVVIQAGASGRGQRFAGRWGEVIFAAGRNTDIAKEGYNAIKDEAAKLGRNPDHIFICNMLTPVTGATKMEAEDRMALISKLPLEIAALSLLAEGVNFDFASKGMDEPLTTEELKGMQGMLGIRDGVLRKSGKTNPSARDFINFSGRGQVEGAGRRPKEIADHMEEMFVNRGWMASSSRRPTCRVLMPTSYATSFRSCSGAASITRIIAARRCAKISGFQFRRSGRGSSTPRRRPPNNSGSTSCVGRNTPQRARRHGA